MWWFLLDQELWFLGQEVFYGGASTRAGHEIGTRLLGGANAGLYNETSEGLKGGNGVGQCYRM